MGQELEHRPNRVAESLLASCHGALEPFLEERRDLLALIDGLIESSDEVACRAALRQRQQFAQFQPSVTMIGQVKAGKTSLVNAMIGTPELLPADVNPWTSVVTSLHIQDDTNEAPFGARFTFFEQDDWDRLTHKGGRMGELAGRSGAEDEAEKVRLQIEAMREKTKRRLGRKFELLLGTSHDYGVFDRDLIKRYVCLGDDDEDGDSQGQFADVTKAADLILQRANWPLPLCLRDTPGVNDTFMMREQITISAIRDSRLCVVVLSAHQALSTVDMALIRLISNVRSREVIIFVNRVDELAQPAAQIDEIRSSIRETLRSHNGPHEAEIIFGSAKWASVALLDDVSTLLPEEADTLISYAEEVAPDVEDAETGASLVWHMSGVPALYDAIWTRITEGIGREQLQSVARQTLNLANGLKATAEVDSFDFGANPVPPVDMDAILHDLKLLRESVQERFAASFQEVLATATTRMERSHRSFLDRATAALIHHLETYGEYAPWTYDPTGLRVLLRSGYQVFARQARSAAEDAGEAAIQGVAQIYGRALQQRPGSFELKAPLPPQLPAPVLLGQTIALDLKGTWWRRWWSRRRGYSAFAEDFYTMIEAETRPIVTALVDTHCRPVQAACMARIDEFFADQTVIFDGMANPSRESTTHGSVANPEELQQTMERLSRLAA